MMKYGKGDVHSRLSKVYRLSIQHREGAWLSITQNNCHAIRKRIRSEWSAGVLEDHM